MPLPEGITVARLLPHEAEAFAKPVGAFLTEAYGGENSPYPAYYRNHADPNDPNQLETARRAIARSSDLGLIGEEAFIVATDDAAPSREEGVVGVGVFTRSDEKGIIIDALQVAPERRRSHIGTAIMHGAIHDLDIDGMDHFYTPISGQSREGAAFLGSVGLEQGLERFNWDTGEVLPMSRQGVEERYAVPFRGGQPAVERHVLSTLGL